MSWPVVVANRFFKDLDKLPESIRARVTDFVANKLPAAENPLASLKLEKLRNSHDCYKVRFGDYRLGLKIDAGNRTIRVCRILHRRDIYRYFP
jgi:mRNA interferase RelE/StbE